MALPAMLEYVVTNQDVAAFWKYHYEHDVMVRKQHVVLRFSVPVILGCMMIFVCSLSLRELGLVMLGVSLPVSMFWVLSFPRRMERHTARWFQKQADERDNSPMTGRHRLEIHDDQLILKTELSEQQLSLTAIRKIVVTRERAFIYANPVSAIIVPAGASDSGEYDDFLMKVHEATPQAPFATE